jgi:hypothetical protein
MDAEAGRNPTSHAFQSEHCRSTPFTQLKTTFSASTSLIAGKLISISISAASSGVFPLCTSQMQKSECFFSL